MFSRAMTMTPVASAANAAKSMLQKSFEAARSPFSHVNNPSDTLQPSVVSIPVSNDKLPADKLPADNASKFPVSFADVLKSKPGSLKVTRNSVVPVSATASAATTSVLDAFDPPIKNLRGIRRDSTLASAAEPPVVGVITQERSSRIKQPPIIPAPAATLVPTSAAAAARRSYAEAVKSKVKGESAHESAGAQPTKRDANRASIRPEPVVGPLTAEQDEELLKEQIKKQFLKEHAEEAKAKKDFIVREEKIVEEIVKQPETTSANVGVDVDVDEANKRNVGLIVESIIKENNIEKNIEKKQRNEMHKRVQNSTRVAEGISAQIQVVSSIPVFLDYSPEKIKDFILNIFPDDAISVLDNFEQLSPASQKEIVDFVILKCKAVTLNTPIDAPGAPDDVYNKVGIKSLSLLDVAGMPSSNRALLVCQVDPLRCPPASEWCCCVGSDKSHDFTDIAVILRNQDIPFVTAHPGIEDMITSCRIPANRVQEAVVESEVAAPAPGGNDPQGFDDPFPSVIIGDERIVYSIGPILDAESVLGRALIMIRIHNYKTSKYPNGIYFWVYPSFSEGGANRVFLTIGRGQFMKGPDYTLTTFILDLLQVHINKYYTKHFVDKQGAFKPTILATREYVVCFFGEMIHLQTQWVHDLIEGRGLDPERKNPKRPVPVNFNRHCYRFSNSLDMKTWLSEGIPSIESFTYSNQATLLLAKEFCKGSQIYTGQSVNSFPLSCCLTTIFHKYRVNKTDVNNFFDLFKRWPDTLFVQGCRIVPGVSPVGCVVSGSSSNLAGMKYNTFLQHLAPSEFVKKFTSLRLVPPIVTPDPGQRFTMFQRRGRYGRFLTRKLTPGGSIENVEETSLMEVNLKRAVQELNLLNQQRMGGIVYDVEKAQIIFKYLPQALKATIKKIYHILVGRDTKVQICFKNFLGIPIHVTIGDRNQLIQNIIMQSVDFSIDRDRSTILTIAKDVIRGGYQPPRISPLYRIIRTLESGIYRHLLMSSMLDEYTGMKSYPLGIESTDPPLNPRVSCAFLNDDGQYVELPGGLNFGGDSRGNFDFSGVFGIFQDPLVRPYIFSATRKSMTFPETILNNYIQDPTRVTAQRAASDATIPVKVHTKMFLLRLVFSTTAGAIQIIVCVSSTISVASPISVGGFPSCPFGVDVQFNVVSIGPLNVDRGSMSTNATILATMHNYLSLGCMVAAKKGEYASTSGYTQFFDYFDYFFKLINTECFTYVSAYMSPFNCGKDLIMKHFGRVFENSDVNPISAAIRGLWDWFPYLVHVQPDVCSKNGGADGLLTPAMIEKAITSGRRNMQMVVGVFFDPILGVLDGHDVGEVTDDSVGSEVGSRSSSSGSSESDASNESSMSQGDYKRFKYGHFSQPRESDEEFDQKHPEFRQSMSSSGSISDGGGRTNKKTRKYRKIRSNNTQIQKIMRMVNSRGRSKQTRKNKKGNNAKKNTTRKNTTSKNKNSNIHTKTNTKTNIKMNKTMKIKSKKFPKRIYLYSTPRTAQRMAYKYLGRIKTAKLYPARNPAKKYMVFDPKNNKWVNFGQMGYEDYTKHHDKTRRKNYLTRTKGMLGDWKSNKYSANNLSRSILWG